MNIEAPKMVETKPKCVNPQSYNGPNMGDVPTLSTMKPLFKITSPFLQRLKNKEEDVKFKNFLSMFNTLSVNISFVEALLEFLYMLSS